VAKRKGMLARADVVYLPSDLFPPPLMGWGCFSLGGGGGGDIKHTIDNTCASRLWSCFIDISGFSHCENEHLF